MSRLLVAAAVTLTGFIALPKEANPEVVTAPTLTRPIPLRASRSVRRHPLPHRRHRRPVVTPTPTPVTTVAPVAAAHDWSVEQVTAYCATGSRNAAGNWPTVGTVAANAYPLGTRLDVEGVGVVVVEDRSAPGATDVDIYMGSGAECSTAATNFGRQLLRVSVVR